MEDNDFEISHIPSGGYMDDLRAERRSILYSKIGFAVVLLGAIAILVDYFLFRR